VKELNRVFLKKIANYDLILSLFFVGMSYFFIKSSALFFLLGIGFAYINLRINSFITKLLILKEGKNKTIFLLIGPLFRVALVCIPGIIIISKSNLNFIIYIIGYTSQLISMILYGLSLRASERKW
jgi:ATP synthase protein I